MNGSMKQDRNRRRKPVKRNRFQATHSPNGVACDKCGKEITPWGWGRRYRMKWRHETCLPETRIKKITPRTSKGVLQKDQYIREKTK